MQAVFILKSHNATGHPLHEGQLAFNLRFGI